MSMANLIDAIVSAIVRAVMKEVLQPNNLRLVFDAWRQANEKQLIEVDKPNEYDKELQNSIDASGMGSVPLPTDKRN
jgi:hypothetical protein